MLFVQKICFLPNYLVISNVDNDLDKSLSSGLILSLVGDLVALAIFPVERALPGNNLKKKHSNILLN